MEVITAKTAGFCFGVERAVKTVYAQIEENSERQIMTAGPIIHNEEVVKDLTDKGVTILDEDEMPEKNSVVIIRSHGIPKEREEEFIRAGAKVEDATCPFVGKIHQIVKEEGEKGRTVVIVGDKNHPEVKGILGWCSGPAVVIQDREEAEKLRFSADTRLSVVSQTTFQKKKFQDLVEIISQKGYDINVVNTICNATDERQKEAEQIAKSVDGMIVIGGRSSSNTQKLFEICKAECDNTIYIQTLQDLPDHWLCGIRRLGITAGASTPKNIIEEVQAYVRTEL